MDAESGEDGKVTILKLVSNHRETGGLQDYYSIFQTLNPNGKFEEIAKLETVTEGNSKMKLTLSQMTDIYASDVNMLRLDPKFQGTKHQISYLREILCTDSEMM